MKKKYDLKKKNTFFEIYGERVLYTFLIILMFIIIYFIKDVVIDLLIDGVTFIYSLIILHGCNAILFMMKLLFVIALIVLCIVVCKYVYVYFSFVYRQQYIPLTKEEIQSYGLKTLSDYDVFLKDYLHGYKPNKKLKELISYNAFVLFVSYDEQLSLFEGNAISLNHVLEYGLITNIKSFDEFLTNDLSKGYLEIKYKMFKEFYFSKNRKFEFHFLDGEDLIFEILAIIVVVVIATIMILGMLLMLIKLLSGLGLVD